MRGLLILNLNAINKSPRLLFVLRTYVRMPVALFYLLPARYLPARIRINGIIYSHSVFTPNGEKNVYTALVFSLSLSQPCHVAQPRECNQRRLVRREYRLTGLARAREASSLSFLLAFVSSSSTRSFSFASKKPRGDDYET